jgi:glycosyltransferase involved in cell wall biosynthesis
LPGGDHDNGAPLLIDASRLVWRRWTGTRASGIDRICLAWLAHYGPRAQAVIIHRHGQVILPFRTSQALFALLLQPERKMADVARFRAALAMLAIRRGGHLRDRLDGHGRIWLNPGHTGLDAPGLVGWVQQRNLRPVHLVHDLIPISHPQFCREGEDARHTRRMRSMLQTAAGVVANSAHTLDMLEKFAASEGLGLPPAIVAWPGTPVLPRDGARHEAEPTFVILGTIEGRKNHALLLSLWRELLRAGDNAQIARLVIVGRRGWQADDVFAQLDSGDLAARVIEAGPLDDRQLAHVLAGSRALLFPSFAEGYGIPLAEALAAGVPVIASDLPVFREIGQGIPDLLPADDLAAWREAVCDYAAEPSPRRTAQLSRLKDFQVPDWPGHFARVDAFLAELDR